MYFKSLNISIFCLLSLLFFDNIKSQNIEFPEDKVSYSIKIIQNACEVSIIADIEIVDSWHINASNLPPESFSIATDLYLDTSSNYIIGDTIYEPKPHIVFDSITKEELFLHEGKITIKRNITVPICNRFSLTIYSSSFVYIIVTIFIQ